MYINVEILENAIQVRVSAISIDGYGDIALVEMFKKGSVAVAIITFLIAASLKHSRGLSFE